MSSRNFTVSHVSPLITYVPGMLWAENGAAQDTLASNYWSSGYHANNASEGEGRLLFTWYGTDVWVFGGYRARLGPYQVVLDGVRMDFDGFQTGDDQDLDAVLFNSTGLKRTTHQIEIINTSADSSRPVLDISRIVYEHEVYTMDNITASDHRCQWSQSASGSQSIWVNSTVDSKTTYSSLATMNITFQVSLSVVCTGIALYGDIGPNNSPFFVSIDGEMIQVLSPNSQVNGSTASPHLLFVKDGLESDNHTLVVRNNPAHSNQMDLPSQLNIAHALAFDSVDPSVAKTQRIHHANILVGSIIGGIALLAAALISTIVWRRRKNRRHSLAAALRARPFLMKVAEASSESPRTPRSRLMRPASQVLSFIRIGTANRSPTTPEDEPPPEWSQVATRPSSPTIVPEDEDEFSPSVTLFSRSNTRQTRDRRKSRPQSMSSVPLVSRSEPPLPLPSPPRPLPCPPPCASPSRPVVAWPDHQLPPPYRTL